MHLSIALRLITLLFIFQGLSSCTSDSVDPGNEPLAQQSEPDDSETQKKNVLFFGDSITAGLGVNPDEAFPALIQAKIDSIDANYKVSNGGLSGETSSGGLRRIDWMMRNSIDIFVFELGANDGLRGINLDLTRSNSEAILDAVREKYPKVKLVIAGMMLPPNMGAEYTQKFAKIFPDLAEKYDAVLIPFILDKVGGISSLNQADGIHPTPEGHKIISNTVWNYLSPLLTE